MGVPPVEPDLSGHISTHTHSVFDTDQINIPWETGRSQPQTGPTGGGQSGGRGGDEGCCQDCRRRPGAAGWRGSSSLLQPQWQWRRRQWWWRWSPPQQRAKWYGLFGQSQQRLRLRPRARPHSWPAGLAPEKNTLEAAAPGRPPGDRRNFETGMYIVVLLCLILIDLFFYNIPICLFTFLATGTVSVRRWTDAHTTPPHIGQSCHQWELGPWCAGRHGNDAQPNCARRCAIQALLWRTWWHGKALISVITCHS